MKNIYIKILFVIITISCDNETKINTHNNNNNNELSNVIERVEPPNWWVGMDTKNLQLLIYGDNISNLEPIINS